MKVFNYVFIFVGIILLANFAGYDTPSAGFVGAITSSNSTSSTNVSSGAYIEDTGIQDVKSSTFYALVISALVIGAGVGIAAGLLGRGLDVNLIISTIVSSLIGLLVLDMIWIYLKFMSFDIIWIKGVASILFTVLIGGFVVSIVEWWQGRD